MSWLDGLLGRIFNNGTEIPLSKGLNFAGGLLAGRNPVTEIVEVVVADGGVGAAEAAPQAAGAAIGVVLSVTFDGSSRDAELFSAAPWSGRIVQAWTKTTTGVGGSSARWRSQTGGNGAALTGIMSTASSDDTVWDDDAASPAFAQGSGVHLRLSTLGIVGEAFLLVVKT